MKKYDLDNIDRKVKKLSPLYNMKKPRDIFTLVIQEMEVYEAIWLARNKDKCFDRKWLVLKIIGDIAEKQKIENFDFRWVSAYIDDMAVATKCNFAINKKQMKPLKERNK